MVFIIDKERIHITFRRLYGKNYKLCSRPLSFDRVLTEELIKGTIVRVGKVSFEVENKNAIYRLLDAGYHWEKGNNKKGGSEYQFSVVFNNV